jgi:xylulokinase
MPVIAIDVGSTVCKAAIFDGRRMLAYSCRHHSYRCVEDGWAEQDPLEVWLLVKQLVGDAVIASGAGDSIQAICLSVQGDAMIPLDSRGVVLHAAILGMDTRSHREAADFEARFGRGSLYSSTGMPCKPLNFITKVLWFENNFPELHDRVWKYLTFEDFLAFQLARVTALDFSMASRSMAFSPAHKDWIPEILECAHIDSGHLGNVTPAGAPVGIVRASLADEWGINRSALLISGGHNQCMAAIGSGVIEPGLACYSMGAAEVIGACLTSPRTSPALLEGNFPCYCHAVEDHYFTITLNQSGGLSMEWLRESLLKLDPDNAPALDDLADGVKVWPSPVLFLSHLVGSGTPSCDPFSRASFIGLSLKTGQADLIQAVLDAQAFEARLNVEALEYSDIEIAELRAVDRGAREWKALQIKATVLQRPIHTLRCPEAALMGAAMLAQTAIGEFASVEAARDECVQVASTIEPHHSAGLAYDEAYGRYRTLYRALSSFHRHWRDQPDAVAERDRAVMAGQ